MGRRARIALHWITVLLVVWVSVAAAPWPAAALALSAAAWLILFAASGLGSQPSPPLRGVARRLHPWQHRAVYGALILTSVLCVASLTGRGHELLHDVVAWVVAGGILHAIFHLWRHLRLGDGALRRMTPRMLHGLL